jgi:hypothetical protein
MHVVWFSSLTFHNRTHTPDSLALEQLEQQQAMTRLVQSQLQSQRLQLDHLAAIKRNVRMLRARARAVKARVRGREGRKGAEQQKQQRRRMRAAAAAAAVATAAAPAKPAGSVGDQLEPCSSMWAACSGTNSQSKVGALALASETIDGGGSDGVCGGGDGGFGCDSDDSNGGDGGDGSGSDDGDDSFGSTGVGVGASDRHNHLRIPTKSIGAFPAPYPSSDINSDTNSDTCTDGLVGSPRPQTTNSNYFGELCAGSDFSFGSGVGSAADDRAPLAASFVATAADTGRVIAATADVVGKGNAGGDEPDRAIFAGGDAHAHAHGDDGGGNGGSVAVAVANHELSEVWY